MSLQNVLYESYNFQHFSYFQRIFAFGSENISIESTLDLSFVMRVEVKSDLWPRLQAFQKEPELPPLCVRFHCFLVKTIFVLKSAKILNVKSLRTFHKIII